MIKRIAITNFKSLDVDFALDPVTVLVGKSGTGKTNLVEAVRFLRDLLRGKAAFDWLLTPATTGDEGEMRFRIEFTVDGVEGAFLYLLDFEYRRRDKFHQVRQEKLSLESRVFYCVRGQQWVEQPKVANLPNPRELVLRSLTGIHEVSIAHVVLTGLGCYDFPGSVCTQDSSEGGHNEGFEDKAQNYAAAFDGIRSNLSRLSAWKEINSALRCLSPSFETIDIGNPRGKRLVVSQNDGGRILTLDMGRVSEGFRRFFAHLIALYQSPPKQTLIFEEPEKGIHPGALATLAEELKACPAAGRGQVVITTHSPGLLDHFSPENIRVVDMDNYVTRIGPLEKSQLDSLKQSLLKPGELLTVDPARIEPVQ
jgi:hypothetical protein